MSNDAPMHKTHTLPFHVYYLIAAVVLTVLTVVTPVIYVQLALGWAALSIWAVTLAYFFESPGLFRKREDGSIPLYIRWIFIPFLSGAQLYNSYERRRDSVPAIQEIEPGLFLACRLFPSDVDTLKQLNVCAVLDVTAEFDAMDWSVVSENIQYLNVPTLDHQAPGPAKMHRAINWVDQQRRKDKGVVIHCALGRGRSVLMMAAYLLAKRPSDSVDDVLRKINQVRDTAMLNHSQYRRLHEAHKNNELHLLKTAWLIANPVSGGGKFAQFGDQIKTELGRYFQLEVHTTSKQINGTQLAEQAKSENCDLVIACGGDGTVCEVASALTDTEIPMAIIPFGTTNALTHAIMGIDTKLMPVTRACEHIINGHQQKIDVAFCNDRLALLVIAVGYEQQMIELADRDTKNRLGQFAYLHGLWQAINQDKHLTLDVSFDQEPAQQISTASMAIANSAPFTTLLAQGNGEPEFTDGMLDVTWLKPNAEPGDQLLSLAELALAATSNIQLRQQVAHRRVKHVVIQANEPLDYVIDGETYHDEKLDIEVKPAALTLITPLPKHLDY